ncbi:uncharacterized protein T551_01720 [Pneumocystis jirovecii RU7]|uniref:Uncharacterized protein n=1 Tax=Pneumocystis jirovecii (strain RU7) TaxID=1408657 RepID=A0A0W4ZPY2_PNEJ7|nr:uncharacterized protein T551_01720 [Pneumocystis jirovecii RU7]KTW30437.1 hypothetical protein T551_01720 [Pneumocystis jirovecii RU7]
MNHEFPNCDDIFSNNSVVDCKEIQKKIKNYIDKKKQKIHLIIRDNYHNLINVADGIIKMKMNFETINQKLKKIIDSLTVKKSDESLINTSIRIKTSIDENKLVYIHTIKLLLYFPQLIRKLISDSEYLLASILLQKINHLNNQFKKIRNKDILLNNIRITESKQFLIKMIKTEICNAIPEKNTYKVLSYLSSLNIIYKNTSLNTEKMFWEIRMKDISNIPFKDNMDPNSFHITLKKIIHTAIIGQYIFPEKFRNFMKMKLKIDNLIVSKYYHIYNKYIYVLENYKLEESLFESDKLNQNDSDNMYIEWGNEILKIIQHNGSNYLNKIRTINSLIEQWNNIILFFNETTFNFSKEDVKLNSFILRLWESTRIIFNKHMNSIFRISVNSVLELEEHMNNQLKNMRMQNESLEPSPSFKVDNKVWNNIESLLNYQIQKPALFIKSFKEELDKIQKKIETDSIIIIQKQEPNSAILKNLEFNTYKKSDISNFHAKLTKDIYNKLSKKIGKIITIFLALKYNNLSNSDNQNSLPNHPSSEIIAIIQDIGWGMMNIDNNIFDYNGLITIKCCFIDTIYSILENIFNTKIFNKDSHYKEYEKYGHNNNNLYYENQSSQFTPITITGQLQFYFDIKYLMTLFGNIPYKNKKLKKINYIINVSIF